MPGAAHELFKSIIGFLLETFLFNRQTEFKPTGSMTQKKDGLQYCSVKTNQSKLVVVK
jgi:hypothetical protein